MGKGLIILDVQELDVSTHSLLPTGNVQDFNNFKHQIEFTLRKKKGLKSSSIRFPCLAVHCIKWARIQFSTFFDKVHDELCDFMQDYATYFEKLRWDFQDELDQNPTTPKNSFERSMSSRATSGQHSFSNSGVGANASPKYENVKSSIFKNHASDASVHRSDKESRDWARYILQLIKEIFLSKNLHNFADCVDLAINLFMEFFHVKILEQVTDYPKDRITHSGKPFWNNIRRFPEPIAINTILHGDLNVVFVKSTSHLLCKFFGFDVPSEDIVNDIIKTKIENQENDLNEVAVNMSNEEFIESINKLERNIKDLKHIPTITLFPINIRSSFNKPYYKDILNFIYSAANIRCMNYKLTLCKKHKVEQTAFKITPNLDMISDIPASLAAIDLIKFCTGTKKEQFRVPHINMCQGTFWFEKNPELLRQASRQSENFGSFSGSDIYSDDLEGHISLGEDNKEEDSQDELEVETLEIEGGDEDDEVLEEKDTTQKEDKEKEE